MTVERSPSVVDRIDTYLRREDTIPARIGASISPKGHEYLDSWQKRWLVDVPMGAAGGVLTAPFTAALCAAVWLEDRGPLFYKDERMGKHGKTVDVWKIRSMRLNADQYTAEEIERINLQYGPAEDPRNTRIGRVIRRFELDEMPQFWQVVRGDFSLNGIRVMKRSFRDAMARVVDPGDMEQWDAAYDRNHGIFNPNATRTRFRKDDKKRIHDDLLYDRKASLGLDYYLLMITALRMAEIVGRWLSQADYEALKKEVVNGVEIHFANRTKREWRLAKHTVNELKLEEELVRRMKYEGEDGHFLDIGASIGLYSAVALKAGMEVTAIDPDHQSFEGLQINAALNAIRDGQFHLIQRAITNDVGAARLFSSGVGRSCPSLRRTLHQRGSVDVPTTTLDELIFSGEIRRPTIIKIDVEGAEMMVLEGGREYFSAADSADIFIEVHPKFLPLFGASAEAIIAKLTEDYGYHQVSMLHKQDEIVYHFSKASG